ncbi:protein ripply2 isoform X1 [Ahaetulla prasina]|uniref:protein ripply2 isoform X1 n=1 Tax=Ahaetulla prasina TaxID=499056 RepID=UPI0026484679|nr:protein ripply2 isoform X1 [Ahaetulla prasina]
MVVDFRRNPSILPPLTILDNTVSTIETFKFLGPTISQDLKWTANIKTVIKKAQQKMFFLRQLRKLQLPKELLIQFYRGIIICTSITVWFGSAIQQDRHRLQRVIRTAEKIIATNLPSIEDLYTAQVKKRAVKIFTDLSHPGHKLFQLPPSKQCYRELHTRTTRHKNSLFLNAITLLNKEYPPHYQTIYLDYKLPKELLIQFYRGIIESVICTSITVWFSSATQQEKHRLQRIIRTAEKIIATNLPSIEDLYTARIKKRAVKIFTDPAHPGHKLFQLLPSKRRYRALHTRTTRHKNSFFPKAITLLNK